MSPPRGLATSWDPGLELVVIEDVAIVLVPEAQDALDVVFDGRVHLQRIITVVVRRSLSSAFLPPSSMPRSVRSAFSERFSKCQLA
jgi:hypothetical protein